MVTWLSQVGKQNAGVARNHDGEVWNGNGLCGGKSIAVGIKDSGFPTENECTEQDWSNNDILALVAAE